MNSYLLAKLRVLADDRNRKQQQFEEALRQLRMAVTASKTKDMGKSMEGRSDGALRIAKGDIG